MKMKSQTTSKIPVSLIILTYNEESNIEFCLRSVADWIGEIIIVDSGSNDMTIPTCRKYTDKIYHHKFENQAKQFNWALDNVPMTYDWIMRLDADEFLTRELANELCDLFGNRIDTLASHAGSPYGVTGIYMKRRVYFMGKWIRHGDYYPVWFIRLFKKGKGRYEQITEEHVIISEGETIRLKNDFVDYNRKGLSFWTDKHINWAIGEEFDTLSFMGHGGLPKSTIETSLLSSQEKRKRWLKKRVYARFPLFVRALLYFWYRYFIRLGFLDGPEGLIFHTLQGFWYRFYVDAKIYEAKKFGIISAEQSVEYSGSRPVLRRE